MSDDEAVDDRDVVPCFLSRWWVSGDRISLINHRLRSTRFSLIINNIQ